MNRLNKIMTLLLMFSFLFCGIALAAIEKDTSKKKTDKTSQNVSPGDSINDVGLKVDGGVKVKRPHGYDDFVDKNNNGIDDRVEQKKDGRKKNISPEISVPNLAKPQNLDKNMKRPQSSPDDSVVKLKNR